MKYIIDRFAYNDFLAEGRIRQAYRTVRNIIYPIGEYIKLAEEEFLKAKENLKNAKKSKDANMIKLAKDRYDNAYKELRREVSLVRRGELDKIKQHAKQPAKLGVYGIGIAGATAVGTRIGAGRSRETLRDY